MLLLSRRTALLLFGSAALAPKSGWGQSTGQRPFEIQYSTDTTDLQTNYSPYNDCTPFDIAKLRASIDEAAAAGIDKLVLQPGTGWVPWWKSQFYPATEHYKWFEQTFGANAASLSGYAKYMLDGGDILGEALRHCRSRNLPLYASIRLNDVHGIMQSGASSEALSSARDTAAQGGSTAFAARQFRGLENIARIHQEHPEWQINPGGRRPADRAWNWAVPQAVEWRRRQLVELCQTYDFDGLQLDFMRFNSFFRNEVPLAERQRIMLEFVRAIRSALNGAFRERRRRLSIKVPAHLEQHAGIGVDVAKFVAAGVDEVVACWHGVTSQEAPWADWAAHAKKARLFVELSDFVSSTPEKTTAGDPNRSKIMCSPEQLVTTAALARKHGFAGATLFNFVYYRAACAMRNRVAPREPPFGVIHQIKTTSSPTDQSFFLGWVGRHLGVPSQLPLRIAPRRPATLSMALSNFGRKWDGEARLLVAFGDWKRADRPTEGEVRIAVNGTPGRTVAIPEHWQAIAGESEKSVAFNVPARALREGVNQISIELPGGAPLQLAYVELQASAT